MDKQKLDEHNKIREIGLQNAEDFLTTAEGLLGKNVNHIAFHLAALSMEEVGRLDLVWFQMSMAEEGREINLATDDHIKKLFWAVWGPSFGKEKITKEQIDERKFMATNIHSRRLTSLYTETTDGSPSREKIPDNECEQFVKFARATLELAKLRKFDEELPEEDAKVIDWWLKANEDPEKRKLIFGHKSQDKLLELGNMREWIKWVKATFDKNDEETQKAITEELQRKEPRGKEREKPKWRVKLKIITPSHSIKNKNLNEFNKTSDWIKLHMGGDNHTLVVEITFSKTMPAQLLWDRGWMISRMFVASLSMGTTGVFWWNVPIDTARYYEEIWDLENNMGLKVELNPRLEVNWKERRLVLDKTNLGHSALVFAYLVRIMSKAVFEPVKDYINGLAMLAKNDVHLRLEASSFDQFYNSFRKALILNKDFDPSKESIKDAGYRMIGEVLEHRREFDKLMDWGEEMQQRKESFSKPITLTEVLGMKQYCDVYFIKLAAKEMTKAKDVKLVAGNPDELSDNKGNQASSPKS